MFSPGKLVIEGKEHYKVSESQNTAFAGDNIEEPGQLVLTTSNRLISCERDNIKRITTSVHHAFLDPSDIFKVGRLLEI